MKSDLHKKAPDASVRSKRSAIAEANGKERRLNNKELTLASARGYQKRICELELKLSAMRAQSEQMAVALSNVTSERDYFAELFHSAPVGYVVLDATGNVVVGNRQAARMLDLKEGERLNGAFVRFVQRLQMRTFLEHMHRSAATGRLVTTELNLRIGRGDLLPVELTTLPLYEGSRPPRLFRTVIIDITGRRNVQETLAQTQHDFQFLLDSLQAVICEADAVTFHVEFVSRLSERLLGFPVEAWYEPGFWPNHIYVKDRERVLNLCAQAVSDFSTVVAEYRFLAADRRTVWLHHRFTVRERHGRLKLVGVAIDITDRKQVEGQLELTHQQLEERVAERTTRLRETVADLEAFSYSLSHDMRAPLRAMQGYAHLLKRAFGTELGSQGNEYLERIMVGAERLDHLIQDVLTFSRVARAPLETKSVDLDVLLDGILAAYPALRGSNVELQVDKPLLPVRGHEVFLTQCVSNLLTNAVKFTRPGKKPHVRVFTQPTVGGVRLCVEDQGIGIAPEDQERIFGIFQRVHSSEQYEGTGIGLAIVQKAVERMGGQLGVESVPGEGSKFWLQLPGVEG